MQEPLPKLIDHSQHRVVLDHWAATEIKTRSSADACLERAGVGDQCFAGRCVDHIDMGEERVLVAGLSRKEHRYEAAAGSRISALCIVTMIFTGLVPVNAPCIFAAKEALTRLEN